MLLQMQSQGLILPPKQKVAPIATHVSTKGSCIDPSRKDPDKGESNKCGLYVDDNHPYLVALGSVYEELTIVNKVSLSNDQVKVGVEEVRDADVRIPVPTQEVQLVGKTLNTFLA